MFVIRYSQHRRVHVRTEVKQSVFTLDCNLEPGSNRNTPNACIIVRNKCRSVRGIDALFRGLPSCLFLSVRVINLGPFRGIFLICTAKKEGKKKARSTSFSL